MQVIFEGVTKRYGDFPAVLGLNLTIEDGALHFLLGPSGCGKTTTLRLLAGLEEVTEGKIFFDEQEVTRTPSAERGIGMVFQNYALWPHMTVLENIEYGLKLRKLSRAEEKTRLDDVLGYTKLDQFADRLPGQLSGGQQQRVALARALAIRPNVLLLDEPLSNLDAKLRLEMRDNITSIHKQTGITTVYVTHDQKEALSMGTAISVQRAGRIIQTDAPRRLYHYPQTPFIAGFIGETNLISGNYLGDGRVDTDLGVLTAGRHEGDFSKGDSVVVSVRPEVIDIHIDAEPTDAANTLNLKLARLTYLGDNEHFHLQTTDGIDIKASLFNVAQHDLSEGDTVTCSVAPEALLILHPEEDLSSGT
jgi:ABC-type Fe3+/spermidine/putrescine transport system ATPase subunit|tara:strand:+ start:4864 stop:5949 length:1086 start_codon:yes stop_codon:yes gene_type:complete